MKLRQNGIVSLMIRPAVFLAGGHAYMKLHQVKSEPQNIDIRYSLFKSFFFDQTGRFSGQRRRSYETSINRGSTSSNLDQSLVGAASSREKKSLYSYHRKIAAKSRSHNQNLINCHC